MICVIIVFGILIGSFLNVCIFRIPQNESIVYPPSHCTVCGTKLNILDLIPVFSYLFLKGRCRYCGEKISPQYPIVELLNAVLYLLLYYEYSFGFLFIKYAIFSSLLIVIFFIDLKFQIIPDRLVVLGLAVSIIFNLYKLKIYFFDGLLGLIIGGGLFLIIAVATNGAMGGGDIKLMGILGFALGWKNILLITFISFVIGAVFSIFLLILKVKSRKDFIPFGPFIATASFITMLYGSQIIHWYISFIG
ncbi:type 4 prepilin peptidase 1 Aspartic peptidase. MEROPS family A24A [Caminicella sporogenes DSM 14501]|uniref:Prepilin leader peptidase/N-methyltransferase n=1 Tax=Caminicella sporogenes DSM 14501 TaxID=1121266 RepID=A0A1M6LP82_9FIRM|nr:A24 family peptidase [Caminicella sporogenes]RKD27898.1 peptidase A24 [Caminicella sporogenes]SHJ72882.1 type 4 prepilin peptidase 1 Aspartic peptidase. MEROPS family A24A [Caminicella sporogenes DSM 14501]